jgi:UDP-2,3-diacylglucosamine pyrophosphatase LpxH
MKDKVVLVSDIHMADPDFPPSQKQRFIGFLEKFVQREARELILLGDIIELSQGRMMDVYETCLDVFLKFLEIANSGTKITYILGNHDFTISDIKGFNIFPHPNIELKLSKEIPVPVRGHVDKDRTKTEKVKAQKILTSGYFTELQAKKTFLAHGHEFNHYFRGNPKRFSSIMKASRVLDKVEPTLDDRALEVLRKSKTLLFNVFYNTNTPGKIGLEGDDLEFLLAARDICKYKTSKGKIVERTDEDRIDYVFFGHTHVQQGPLELKDNILNSSGKVWGTYFNTGAWVIKNRLADYTVISKDGLVQNLQWS